MKILSAEGIKIIENKHITKENISSLALMEKASTAFVNIFIQKFLQKTPVFIFCGPGNNGGDGLVIGRLLKQLNYDINIYALNASKYSSEFIENKNTLEKISSITILKDFIDFPDIPKQAVVIDALFGIGLNKPLHGLSLQLVNHINKSEAKKVAVDIPSGLFSDKTNIKDVILQADVTITFQSPKLSFMFPENTKYVGELVIADLEISDDLINEIPCLHFYSTIKKIKPKIKKREKDGHKGTYGRALIIGGNYGMIGAPALAIKACYASGAGLVKGYVPECGYTIIQTLIPEAMALTDTSFKTISDIPDIGPYNAICMGPGMNEDEVAKYALKKLLNEVKVPLLLDAGALNILGKYRELLDIIPSNTILTPHPKEFERLTENFTNGFEKLEGLIAFSKKTKCIVVLKGAHTAIALPDGRVYFNSTGNPGMATGGSGDVLSGIITGLLAQAYNAEDAAILGVFLHGCAGDIAANSKSQHAMMASDIIDGIGGFYKEILIK